MRNVLLCIAVVAFCIAASAQEYPKSEVFGGFQYNNVDAFEVQHVSLLGWNAQFTDYLNEPFGITAEVTGSYGSPTVGEVGTTLPTYTFMFGPTMRTPLEKSTPFVHALFGAAHMRNTKGIYSSTGFAMALGGGFDTKLSESVDWRIVQVDYLMTRLQDATGSGNGHQNNFRFATGIVIKF